MKQAHALPLPCPVTGSPLVPTCRITTPTTPTSTMVPSWEMLMRRTLRASWMTTSNASWRPLAASPQGRAAIRPNPAPRRTFHQAETLGFLGPLLRVNIHQGTVGNTHNTSITAPVRSPKSSWRPRQPCECTAATMDQNLAPMQTVQDTTQWSTQATGMSKTTQMHHNCLFLYWFFLLFLYSSKCGPCKRAFKKGEEVRLYDTPGSGKDMEIHLWLMEGQKEMVRHKKSPYGWVVELGGFSFRLQ